MTDPFVGEIRMFAGNFAPRNWYFCAGQTLSIVQNDVLFAIIFNQFGGNGQTEFRLPDMRGFVPMHHGNSVGPGLTPNYMGEYAGYYSQTINSTHMPEHTHTMRAPEEDGDTGTPGVEALLAEAQGDAGPGAVRRKEQYAPYDATKLYEMNPDAVSLAGSPSGQPTVFSNFQPYQTCSFIICHTGIFPPRS
jgi:microcystin-dependent protein